MPRARFKNTGGISCFALHCGARSPPCIVLAAAFGLEAQSTRHVPAPLRVRRRRVGVRDGALSPHRRRRRRSRAVGRVVSDRASARRADVGRRRRRRSRARRPPRLRAAPRAARQPRTVREARADADVAARRPRATSRRDVTHLALSHYHWDHTADANLFADAQWLVSKLEHDAMFCGRPARRHASRDVLGAQERAHDADHGDRARRVRRRHGRHSRRRTGHTEGHSVLYVKLAKTGGVVLSGDLYHYPAERTLKRLPTFEVSEAETQAARDELEQFLRARARSSGSSTTWPRFVSSRRRPSTTTERPARLAPALAVAARRRLASQPAPEPLEALADAAGRGERRAPASSSIAVVAAQHAERPDPRPEPQRAAERRWRPLDSARNCCSSSASSTRSDSSQLAAICRATFGVCSSSSDATAAGSGLQLPRRVVIERAAIHDDRAEPHRRAPTSCAVNGSDASTAAACSSAAAAERCVCSQTISANCAASPFARNTGCISAAATSERVPWCRAPRARARSSRQAASRGR